MSFSTATSRFCMAGLLIISAASLGSAQSSEAMSGKKFSTLPAGTWGGQHIAMEVTASGAQIELDCAHGQINGPIQVDSKGRFEATGTFAAEHGGPIRREEENTPPPSARFVGEVKGDTVVMTISLAHADKPAGTYTLKKDAQPRMMKCR